MLGEVHLMGDDQHGHSLPGQLPHDLQDFTDQLGIERRRRFVKVNDLRVHCQGPGDRHSLLLTAGELDGIVAGPVRHADLFQHLHADVARFTFLHSAGRCQPQGHVVDRGLIGEKVVVLKDEGGFLPDLRDLTAAHLPQIIGLAVKDHGAGISLLQKIDAAQKRGLAAPARSQDRDDVPFVDRQVDPVQYRIRSK